MRCLNRAVVAGGVVYPAGTAATPELEEQIPNPAHWDGDPTPTSGQDAPPSEDRISGGDYQSHKVAELQAEIDVRNTNRDPGGDTYLSREGRKADLVAALEADDVRGGS